MLDIMLRDRRGRPLVFRIHSSLRSELRRCSMVVRWSRLSAEREICREVPASVRCASSAIWSASRSSASFVVPKGTKRATTSVPDTGKDRRARRADGMCQCPTYKGALSRYRRPDAKCAGDALRYESPERGWMTREIVFTQTLSNTGVSSVRCGTPLPEQWREASRQAIS